MDKTDRIGSKAPSPRLRGDKGGVFRNSTEHINLANEPISFPKHKQSERQNGGVVQFYLQRVLCFEYVAKRS